MLNHLEFHKQLTRKDELLSNLRTQLLFNNENIFDYTPISFQINIPEGKYQTMSNFLNKFLKIFEVLYNSKKTGKTPGDPVPFDQILKKQANESNKDGNGMKVLVQKDVIKYICPACHFVGGNYWVFKTTHQNRGIGINVFRSLSQLEKILGQYMSK